MAALSPSPDPILIKYHFRSPDAVPVEWVRRQPKRLQEALSHRVPSGCLFATLKGKILSEAIFHDQGDRIEITWLYTRGPWRRKGLATNLLKLMLEYLHNPPYQGILCSVEEHNVGLQCFLRSRGFKCKAISNDHKHYAFELELLKPA